MFQERFPTPALPRSGAKGRGAIAALSRNSPSELFKVVDYACSVKLFSV